MSLIVNTEKNKIKSTSVWIVLKENAGSAKRTFVINIKTEARMSLHSQILGSQISPFQKTQEQRAKLKPFRKILQEVGITLSFNEEPHILKQEQALVLRDLDKILQPSENICEEFVNGLKILCKKEKQFKKTLLLTHLKKDDNNDTLSSRTRATIEQDSLMR